MFFRVPFLDLISYYYNTSDWVLRASPDGHINGAFHYFDQTRRMHASIYFSRTRMRVTILRRKKGFKWTKKTNYPGRQQTRRGDIKKKKKKRKKEKRKNKRN
jgi:hypothetical protein